MRYLAPVHTSSVFLSSGEFIVDDSGYITVDADTLTGGDINGLAVSGFVLADQKPVSFPAVKIDKAV